MAKPPPIAASETVFLPPLQGWIDAMPSSSPDEAAFQAGAALAHVSLLAGQGAVPQALWRDRLALASAEVCVGLSERREGAGALRDAAHLTRPGDHPGPAGAVLRIWSRAVARPISVRNLGAVLEGVSSERIALCLDAVGGTPVDRAAAAIEAMLTESPCTETSALILADAVLSKSLDLDHILPLLALALKRRDLAGRGKDLHLACHRAVVAAARQAAPMAADLARRAARLQAVAPKLRAKGAARVIDLFLARDAIAPAALTPFMSDRSARRLCDRLVDLGVVREVTGRDSFRLYGL